MQFSRLAFPHQQEDFSLFRGFSLVPLRLSAEHDGVRLVVQTWLVTSSHLLTLKHHCPCSLFPVSFVPSSLSLFPIPPHSSCVMMQRIRSKMEEHYPFRYWPEDPRTMDSRVMKKFEQDNERDLKNGVAGKDEDQFDDELEVELENLRVSCLALSRYVLHASWTLFHKLLSLWAHLWGLAWFSWYLRHSHPRHHSTAGFPESFKRCAHSFLVVGFSECTLYFMHLCLIVCSSENTKIS